MRSMLIISRRSPWSGSGAREALDIALAGGAFDLPISLLLIDDGVFQLVPGQSPGNLEQKDMTANLQALPLFGVEAIHVCQRSLGERGLLQRPLAIAAIPLDDEGLRALVDNHDHVITL
ncbi:sulfurtransferase complex subunit TusC [Stutzerimonas kirkiae]|uniref:Sulfurtransferase complex subunit TusC n=1 Tax=Stutzerimonas kirkiae TaxID=2211392 RepID=A0A4Q9R823_9GAMM|nr:sulfurtransferase complex subunit TusC [Stutzerimonas kirkiae]TBU96067.1 sulfurtransferase complex subunit TusC [Stutzerimonas kirkiae]TBV03101.1 sulfurtransferase complex subunit TusC [Stutzerimonas kirkiae]TBV09815.1 sulfurtransferase complex subunit TusC [Stutzerimonas kirkiae]TBV13455.1 sulfurtransferase complex subunit TusC [Stutzerimonas kirkiae]